MGESGVASGGAGGRLALALCAASVVACARSGAPPACPSHGGSPWLELTTQHFVVVSDLDDERARDAARGYEEGYEELRAAAFPGPDRGSRTTIVLFRDEEERRALRPRGFGGEYIDTPRLDLERSPTIVVNEMPYAMNRSDEHAAFMHELTHRFVRQAFNSVPVWMNEGLAQYFSTLRVEGGQAFLGQPPWGYRLTVGALPSVHELVTVDRDSFYAGKQSNVVADDARWRYYLGSWAFVHFLRNGPEDLRPRFQAFAIALGRGTSAAEAWRDTLGAIPPEDLERAFLVYQGASRWDLLVRDVQPAPPSPVLAERALRDDEVHVLWADIADATIPATDPISPDVQLAEAAREAPSSPELLFRRACLARARRLTEEAVRLFDGALAAAPDNPRYLYGDITAHLEAPRATEREHYREVAPLGARLATVAKSADEIGMVAVLLAVGGDDEGAMRRVGEALKLDPGYYHTVARRARIHFEAKRYSDAVRDLETAVALTPEGMADRSLGQQLLAYRDALAGSSRKP